MSARDGSDPLREEDNVSKKTFNGTIALDIRDSVPDWGPYAAPKAPPGSPNILYIVIDDTGFGAWEMFGGLIKMPNLARIARRGLVYTNFHTTALCSPTRSSLLNGRNATSNGMSCIEEATTGFPGNNGRIPFENAMIAAVLADEGYSTFAVGKWHLLPEEEANLASTKRHWPLGRGFERYYGFLGGETDQWYPDLVYDNHITEQPYEPNLDDPEGGYHLSKDLADKAITFIQDSVAIAPDKPWLMYFSPGANHAPHQIWPEKILEYGYNTTTTFVEGSDNSFEKHSTFSMGYERYREVVLENMKKLGIFSEAEVPEPTEINPHGEPGPVAGVPDGAEWPETDHVIPWDDDLSQEERALFVRMAEIYAAFSTYTDEQIGRLLDFLEKTGQLDNTIIIAVADNGASAEGGPNGSVNENLFFNDVSDDFDNNFAKLQELGTDKTYNHYPTGWAWGFDAPFKYWKRWSSYEGGTATPMMICGPGIGPYAKPKITPEPYIYRKQYIHAVDVVPTFYDMLGLEPPEVVRGYSQNPIEGLSFKYTFDPAYGQPEFRRPYALSDELWPRDPQGEKVRVRESQFYSMLGTRGIWHKGWFACTAHPPTSNWGHFDEDQWELYCLEGDSMIIDGLPAVVPPDPAQRYNLVGPDENDNPPAPEFVAKLQTMIYEWFTQAGLYYGMPLDDRSAGEVLGSERPTLTPDPFPDPDSQEPYTYTYYPGGSEIPEAAAPNVRTRSFAIEATLRMPELPPGSVAKGRARRALQNVEPAVVDLGGVLFAHGGRFGGHALYIQANGNQHELVYVYNWIGEREQRASVVFDASLWQSGEHMLRVEFRKDENLGVAGDIRYGSAIGGRVSFVLSDGNSAATFKLGEDTDDGPSWQDWTPDDNNAFVTQPGKFALCGEGMNIGRDAGQAVSHDYSCPNAFTSASGITLEKVEVTLYNDGADVDQSLEFRGMLWRD